jgi:hypothetical protein
VACHCREAALPLFVTFFLAILQGHYVEKCRAIKDNSIPADIMCG